MQIDTYYGLMRRQGITRRSFLKFCSLTAASLGLGDAGAQQIAKAISDHAADAQQRSCRIFILIPARASRAIDQLDDPNPDRPIDTILHACCARQRRNATPSPPGEAQFGAHRGICGDRKLGTSGVQPWLSRRPHPR